MRHFTEEDVLSARGSENENKSSIVYKHSYIGFDTNNSLKLHSDKLLLGIIAAETQKERDKQIENIKFAIS